MNRIRQRIQELWQDHGIYVIILGGLAFGALHATLSFFRRREADWK